MLFQEIQFNCCLKLPQFSSFAQGKPRVDLSQILCYFEKPALMQKKVCNGIARAVICIVVTFCTHSTLVQRWPTLTEGNGVLGHDCHVHPPAQHLRGGNRLVLHLATARRVLFCENCRCFKQPESGLNIFFKPTNC